MLESKHIFSLHSALLSEKVLLDKQHFHFRGNQKIIKLLSVFYCKVRCLEIFLQCFCTLHYQLCRSCSASDQLFCCQWQGQCYFFRKCIFNISVMERKKVRHVLEGETVVLFRISSLNFRSGQLCSMNQRNLGFLTLLTGEKRYTREIWDVGVMKLPLEKNVCQKQI